MDLWRWKDSVLGDGRDFFVPKPKTLTALNRLLLERCSFVQECAVLSNCARFEILVWSADPKTDPLTIQHQVAHVLAAQLEAHQKQPMTIQRILAKQFSGIDTPDSIDTKAAPCTNDAILKDITSYWNCISGVESVCHYLCLVAAGMAIRPNRPELKVPVFRPFSSRDAHILLQLKRSPTEGGNHVRLLWDAARSAGKAARDTNRVPELASLRPYGTSDHKKYSIDPPIALQEAVTQAAMQRAIEPTVRDCIERWNAMHMSSRIITLRQRIERMAQTDEERKWLRKEIHQPSMDLRQGIDIDVESLVQELELQLMQQRQ